MEKELTIGSVRQQSALMDASERVVLCTSDPTLLKLLDQLVVTECYPDTRDERGNWNRTFKIKVEKR